MTLEQVVEALKRCTQDPSVGSCAGCPYEDVGDTFAKCCLALMFDCLDLLKAQEPRVTCSVCKYSRCLSGEWFCFMIGTSRYGKRVTGGDWYCKDAIRR